MADLPSEVDPIASCKSQLWDIEGKCYIPPEERDQEAVEVEAVSENYAAVNRKSNIFGGVSFGMFAASVGESVWVYMELIESEYLLGYTDYYYLFSLQGKNKCKGYSNCEWNGNCYKYERRGCGDVFLGLTEAELFWMGAPAFMALTYWNYFMSWVLFVFGVPFADFYLNLILLLWPLSAVLTTGLVGYVFTYLDEEDTYLLQMWGEMMALNLIGVALMFWLAGDVREYISLKTSEPLTMDQQEAEDEAPEADL